MASDWRETELGRLGRVVTGRTPSKDNPEHWGDVLPFLTPTDMDGRRKIADTQRRLSPAGATALSRVVVPQGVAVSCIGWQMGKAVLVEVPTATNQQINTVMPDLMAVDRLFLYYSLCVRREEIFRLGAGGSRTPILKKSGFEKLRIAVPPLPEQRRIAAILGALDDKIELNRKMNRTLEEMAQALFKSWFIDFDGHDPEGLVDSELGPIPMGWKVGSVYEIASVAYGAPYKSSMFNTEGRGLPLIRIRDLTAHSPEVFTEEVHPRGHLIRPGDLVVGMDGEFRAHVWRGKPAWLNQRVCKFLPKQPANAAFVEASIREPLAYFERGKTGTTVIHLGKADIDTFRVVVPTERVLMAFSLLSDPLVLRRVNGEQEIRTLAELRDTLLPKLISGEIRVPEAEDAVEAAL